MRGRALEMVLGFLLLNEHGPCLDQGILNLPSTI